jgi:hypothetical protein
MGRNVKTLEYLWWLQLEKAKTYVFAEPLVRDREVGGSNSLAPTSFFNTSFQPWPDSISSSGLFLAQVSQVTPNPPRDK